MQGLVVGLEPSTRTGTAWLAKGFRPFFLAAGAYAALAVPAWIAVLLGPPWLAAPSHPLAWHAHEMGFGFVGAVMAGFLLTAVSNWTGRRTVDGGALGALLMVWLGGRVAPWVPGLSGLVPAAFDVAFWAGLTIACARPIVAARSRRNYGFIALLVSLLLASTLSHASQLGFASAALGSARTLGVDLIVIPILVVTGRVVPMFTRNATAATDISSRPALDRVVVGLAALIAILNVTAAPLGLTATVSGITGCIALLRARRWGAQHTFGQPLLWSLHLGHAWLGTGLILRGLSGFIPELPPSVGLHAITAGGIGLLCLGMMTRVTLGHTGRMLAVPQRMAWAMRALSLAAVLRVVGPLVMPARTHVVLGLAALSWSLAFALYLLVYARALIAPRVDGRAG